MKNLDLKYQQLTMNQESIVLVFENNCLYMHKDYSFLNANDVDSGLYLFKYNDKHYFLGNKVNDESNYIKVTVREIRERFEHDLAMALAVAIQLNRFYETNKYCGKCGKELKHASNERVMVCECTHRVYPSVAPATITMIIDREKDRILMTRSKNMISGYGLVAGFMEAGETFEECALREIKEEVQLKVKNLKYYANQEWGFGSNIMVAFTCELDGSDEFVMQEEELSEVWWQKREDIEYEDHPLSVGHKMVQAFRNHEI